jgi:hypothetical protein
VFGVVPNEVNYQSIAVAHSPANPIINRRLNIEHGVTVQFRRVHFAYLIGSSTRVGSTIHSGENQSLGMEDMTSELARVAKLKDALSDFQSCAVNFIEEEDNGSIASHSEPIGRTEGGDSFINSRQTQKVAFGHLTSAAFHDRHIKRSCILVNHRGLTNSVATTEQDGVIRTCNVREDEEKILEVNSHFFPS